MRLFVSYYAINKNNETSIGRMILNFPKKRINNEAIEEIESFIRKDKNFKNVVLLNIQKIN